MLKFDINKSSSQPEKFTKISKTTCKWHAISLVPMAKYLGLCSQQQLLSREQPWVQHTIELQRCAEMRAQNSKT
eukprot:2578296-Amphidinium_carterae.1